MTILALAMAWGVSVRASDSPARRLAQEVTAAFQGHDYEQVIHLYRDFEASRPNDFIPLVVRTLYSQSLADTGQINGAIDVLKQMLADLRPEVDPLRLQYDLANLLYLQKRYDEARVAYQKIQVRAEHNEEILAKAKERLALMKGRDSNAKKRDIASLQMIDLETSLDAGEVPDGASALLKRILSQNPNSPQADKARHLQERVKVLRTKKAKILLDEARRLFDNRKYPDVQDILSEIHRSYMDVSDTISVKALQKAVNGKLRH